MVNGVNFQTGLAGDNQVFYFPITYPTIKAVDVVLKQPGQPPYRYTVQPYIEEYAPPLPPPPPLPATPPPPSPPLPPTVSRAAGRGRWPRREARTRRLTPSSSLPFSSSPPAADELLELVKKHL